VLKGHATLTMSATRRIRERRWGTGRDGGGPASVDHRGRATVASSVARGIPAKRVRSMLPIVADVEALPR
jgi:hypothetical protein